MNANRSANSIHGATFYCVALKPAVVTTAAAVAAHFLVSGFDPEMLSRIWVSAWMFWNLE
jgi:hypothetical protein